jgi:hypothetical protein
LQRKYREIARICESACDQVVKFRRDSVPFEGISLRLITGNLRVMSRDPVSLNQPDFFGDEPR